MSAVIDRFDPDARIPQEALADVAATRVRIADLAEWVDMTFADGREKSLALTKLEEASHWLHSAARTTQETNT